MWQSRKVLDASPITLEATASLRRPSTGSKLRLKAGPVFLRMADQSLFLKPCFLHPRILQAARSAFSSFPLAHPSTHTGSSKCQPWSRNVTGKWDFLMLLNFLPSSSRTSGHCQVFSFLTLWLLQGLLFWSLCSILPPNSAAPSNTVGDLRWQAQGSWGGSCLIELILCWQVRDSEGGQCRFKKVAAFFWNYLYFV